MALEGYRAAGDRAGEGRALWCLVDVLRLGTAQERTEGRNHAAAALRIFENLHYPYNTARAHNYVALAAFAQGDLAAAGAAWERALAGAQGVGNVVLEPLVLMNLGAVQARLGQYARQLDYLNRGAKLFEGLGQQQRFSEVEANAAALLIRHSDEPEQGLRRLQNAMQVARKLGNTNFEVFASMVTAEYHRLRGRTTDAERELNRALAMAKERDLQDRIQLLTTELARVRFASSDYTGAAALLGDIADGAEITRPIDVRLLRAHIAVRLGDFEAARRELSVATRELDAGGDPQYQPQLYAIEGELAYESANRSEARARFTRAAALWTDMLPDPASVEARAYVGLLDALDGRIAAGRGAVQASLEHAHRLGHLALETRCRLHLARIDLAEHKYRTALQTLDGIPPDDATRSIGAELRAQAAYWRSRALAGLADPAAAADAERARRIIHELQAKIPEPLRARFATRADIRLIIG
jgi:predicted negative regulator of RcsB-dependent stress response